MANIAETAKETGSFATLLAAVEAAGLVDALTGNTSLTVFAPTDEAFGKLPEGTVEELLNDVPRLKNILTYHVVEGTVSAEDVAKLDRAKTLQGTDLTIDTSNGVKLNDAATVVRADIKADNGMIHVIDTVLLPA